MPTSCRLVETYYKERLQTNGPKKWSIQSKVLLTITLPALTPRTSERPSPSTELPLKDIGKRGLSRSETGGRHRWIQFYLVIKTIYQTVGRTFSLLLSIQRVHSRSWLFVSSSPLASSPPLPPITSAD